MSGRLSTAAFWDFWEAMGGEASMLGFQKRHWNQWDLCLLNDKGASYMASRLVHALWSGSEQWAKSIHRRGAESSRRGDEVGECATMQRASR